MDKSNCYSPFGGLKRVKEAYVKPCAEFYRVEVSNMLCASGNAGVNPGDLNHGDGGLLSPQDDNSNPWEDGLW